MDVGSIVVIGGKDDGVRAVSTDGTQLWSQPTLWSNLQVRSTADGEFVSFATEASGGD
ncbi:MAG: hypothetical protein MUF83_23115 [Acidimicrobiales bacterium]|nr:hypothetical protein [Acidimicrobiales bacterium]